MMIDSTIGTKESIYILRGITFKKMYWNVTDIHKIVVYTEDIS